MKNIEDKIEELEGYFKEEMSRIKKLIVKEKSKDLFTITTYDSVVKELKEASTTDPYLQIKQIEKLFNGDWKKDWYNENQKKYYPYFNFIAYGGSVGFHTSCYCYCFSTGAVAVYKDEQTSNHVGKHFWEIYKKLITG